MSRRATVTTAFAGATLVGLATGWFLAQRHDRAHRHELFARSAWRRFAALGYLEDAGDGDDVPLLRDYLAWEPKPALQARARRVLAALEAAA